MAEFKQLIKLKERFSPFAVVLDLSVEMQRKAVLFKRKSNQNSITTFLNLIPRFLAHLSTDFKNIRRAYIDTKLNSSHLKSSSQIRLYYAITPLLKVLKEEEIITEEEEDSIKDLKPKQLDKKKRTFPTVDQLTILINHILNQKGNSHYDKQQMIFIIVFLVNTGLRITEALSVCIHEIDLVNSTVYIKNGKNNKSRTVGLNVDAINAIQNYLNLRPETNCQTLIVQKNGKPYTSYRVIANRLKRVTKKNKIDVSLHSMRRYCARNLALGNKLPLSIAARSLGHSKIDVFQESYCILDDSEVINAVINTTGFSGKEVLM